MLHRMQPVRMRYLREQLFKHNLASLSGGLPATMRVLDIGCGGGLMSEPLARLGAKVVAIDSSKESLLVARQHAKERGLSIDYRNKALQEMEQEMEQEEMEEGKTFDLLCAMEVIEHVDDPRRFLEQAARLLKDKGIFVLSTLNRTAESWIKGILVAERVLGLVPRGTHAWNKFVPPDELRRWSEAAGLEVADLCGMRYRLRDGEFELAPACLSFNYIATLHKNQGGKPRGVDGAG